MKRILWAVAGVAVLALAVVGVSGCTSDIGSGSLEIKGNLNSQQEGIWVNGNGKVTAVPDVAILSLGIEAQAATVEEAQAQASNAMADVMAALKGQGIDEKDIQTQYFNIQRVTRWDNDTQQETIIGYRVSNMVTAKVRVIANTGTVIDVVAKAGGDLTRINSIGFTVDDPEAYQAEAREKAVADAAAKAKVLADTAGVKLGTPTYISESSYIPGPIYRDVAMEAVKAPAPVETPISAGEMEINVSVQIAYAID